VKITTSIIESVLTELYERRGTLRPVDIVTEARADDHRLHECFEWDDSIAADRFRLFQAGALIRRVTIVQGGDDEQAKVRRFHPTSYIGREPNGYVALEDFSESERALLLRRMESDWRTLRRRYSHLEKELFHLVAADMPGGGVADEATA
jgi:hypothetical protein